MELLGSLVLDRETSRPAGSGGLESLAAVLVQGIREFRPLYDFHPDGPKLGVLLYLLQTYGLDATTAALEHISSKDGTASGSTEGAPDLAA